MTRIKKSFGFTLIELIVVIVIIGILAAIAAVAYNQFIANANETSSLTTAQQIADGAQATAVLANVSTGAGTVDAGALNEIIYTGSGGGSTSVFALPDGVPDLTQGSVAGQVITINNGGECATVTFPAAGSPVGTAPAAVAAPCP